MKKIFNILLIYFLCLVSFVANIKNVSASDIKEGDLIKTKDSSAIYLIQNGERKVFPHSSVYLSWGYPEDFSTVKTVTKYELFSYPFGGAIIYRDGFVFRFDGVGMPGGFDPSAVFFVSDGKVRPIDSVETYMKLFNKGINSNSAWNKIYWIPKDLLENFTYPKGENITSNQIENGQLPNGFIARNDAGSTFIINDGQLDEISEQALSDNRYTTNKKIFENNLVSKISYELFNKIPKGLKISSKNQKLLNIRSIDITMIPVEQDNNSNTGSIGTNTNTGGVSNTSSVINTTPLTPTNIIPLSKPSEDLFVVTSVLMGNDSDKIINIKFNKNVQNTSARNRANYTFKKLDGTVLNSTTGGSRIDSNGHPLVTPVRSSIDNSSVTITLGTNNEYNTGIPSGTYQLCISNIKTATGNSVLPTTCKQFNVINTIRPNLYDNSSTLEYDVNYLASANKILIKYSEPMGNSAISASNYKIRDFNSSGITVTSWIKLSSINGTNLSFANNNQDVLISLPNNISLLDGETDLSIGDPSNINYVPRDVNGNYFEETIGNSTYLTSSGYGINVDSDGISLNNNIDDVEILSTNQVAIDFSREIGSVDVNDFKFKNFINTLGFYPLSATIDTKNSKRVIFTVSDGNAFSASDNAFDFGIQISYGYGNVYAQNTKDILGLPVYYNSYSYGDWLKLVNYDEYYWIQSIKFSNNIGVSISSFVVANPNTIYLKFDKPINSNPDNYYNLSRDLIIEQGDKNIQNWYSSIDNTYGYGYKNLDGSMSVFGGGSNLYDYKPSNIIKILFSSSLDLSQNVTLKTFDSDSIISLGENSPINANTVGINNSVFAAYSVDKGFHGNDYFRQTASYGYGINLNFEADNAYQFSFNVVDDNSVPCYENNFNKDSDYFTNNYYMAVNSIANNISIRSNNRINEITISCDVDGSGSGKPLYLGFLKDALESYYTIMKMNGGFIKMNYPYHYNDNTILEPLSINSTSNDYSNDYNSYYTISYGVNNFLSIRFNKKVDLNTLSSGGWNTLDGISYGKQIYASMTFDDKNNSITFNGINLGEFRLDGTNSYIDSSNVVTPAFDATYVYDYSTNILTINIDDSSYNMDASGYGINIYTQAQSSSLPNRIDEDGFIIYIPNQGIKDVDGNSIDYSFTPYANLREQ